MDGLQFDPELVIRGLIMDKERGNMIKARASWVHGCMSMGSAWAWALHGHGLGCCIGMGACA